MFRKHYRLLLLGTLVTTVLGACSPLPSSPSEFSFWGAPNFRDLGGLETTDGRHIKMGLLFRSDALAELDTTDLYKFERLELQTIFDLRHEHERLGDPNNLPPLQPITQRQLPVLYPPLDRRESSRKILSAEVPPGHFEQLLVDANAYFALEFTEEWSEILKSLGRTGTLPALIHCVDGKDRTGFAVALILRTLGVPEETVIKDFLKSNEQLAQRIDRLAFLAHMGSMFRVPREDIRPLMEVRRPYLESAFAAIDREYGSLDSYLREGLGLSEADLARLRDALLE